MTPYLDSITHPRISEKGRARNNRMAWLRIIRYLRLRLTYERDERRRGWIRTEHRLLINLLRAQRKEHRALASIP